MSLVNCSFEDNTVMPHEMGTSAVIYAGIHTFYGRGDASVRLEGCTFSGNMPSSLPVLVADNRAADWEGISPVSAEVGDASGGEIEDTYKAVFYSDAPSPSVCAYEGHDRYSTSPPCESSTPLALSAAGGTFLSRSSPWLVQQQEVCCVNSPFPLP